MAWELNTGEEPGSTGLTSSNHFPVLAVGWTFSGWGPHITEMNCGSNWMKLDKDDHNKSRTYKTEIAQVLSAGVGSSDIIILSVPGLGAQ